MMKKMILGTTLVSTLALGTGVELQFYDEALPRTLNPLFAATMVDMRAQELYFDRLYYNDPIDYTLKSRLVNDSLTRLEDAGKSLKLTINPNIRWHNGKKIHICRYLLYH